jgi:hypothetical protein
MINSWSTMSEPRVSDIQQGVWTHVTLTFNGREACKYINGNLQSSWKVSGAEETEPESDADLSIGGALDGTIPRSSGASLAEVRVWSRALSAEETRYNYRRRLIASEHESLLLNVSLNETHRAGGEVPNVSSRTAVYAFLGADAHLVEVPELKEMLV